MSSISAGTTSTTTLVHSGDTTGSLVFKTNDTGSGGTTAVTIDTLQNVGIGTTSPTTATDIVRSNTSGNDNQMPNLFVRNTSATQGNGSSTFNQAGVSVSAGNSTVGGGIRAAYDSAGSYGTGVQFYVNSTNPLQFYSNGSERMRIDSSGNLLVGTTSVGGTGWSLYPTGYAITNGANSTFTHISFQTSSAQKGYIQTVGSTTNYNGSSDYRLKENVEALPNALQTIAQLKPVKFNWKEDGSVAYSFIAHELQEVVPQAVGGTKDEVDENGKPVYQGIDPSKLVCFLTAAIKELKAINDQQAETINAQSAALAALTARVVALEGK